MTVHVARNDARAGVRVGFVVAGSVGPAVVRNRVRRRLRHLMRTRLAGLPSGIDLVVRAQPATAGLPSSALAAELDKALSRALVHTSALVHASALGHTSALGA
ncbi:MAG: ribonuclease protein component [Pseudonocardiales bacterium]|nr:ribonuclease protein component [Pseudonocardiales bacterium]